jgi:hypothetical protein
VVLAPAFLGAEPTTGTGRFEGVHALGDETETALTFRRGLDPNREDEFPRGSSRRACPPTSVTVWWS